MDTEAAPATRTCEDCKWCLLDDWGYSNWTTEGTYVYCLKRLHPAVNGFDRWYGEDVRLRFAEQCEGFTAGGAVSVDVDREEVPYDPPGARDAWWIYYTDDPEQRALIAAWDANPPTGEPEPNTEGQPEEAMP